MARFKKRSRFRRYSPRNRYRRFRRGKAPIPILPVLAVSNGLLIKPLFGDHDFYGALNHMKDGDSSKAVTEFIDVVGINFFGTKLSDQRPNPVWTQKMIENYTTIALGVAGHIVAQKLGINKHIRKIPLIGKYVAL